MASVDNKKSSSGQGLIRVCYLIDSLRRDGAQTALCNLVSGLADRGYLQQVYCLNDVVHRDIVERLTQARAHVEVIGKVSLATGWGLLRIFRDLRRWQPAITVTFLPFADVIGRTLAKMAGIPVIVSSVRTRSVDRPRWHFLLCRLTSAWADKVVFNSKDAISFSLTNEGVRSDQVVYIPNGVGIDPIRHPGISAAIRSELSIPSNAMVVGTIGRLYPQKGHVYLLRAFEKVLRLLDNVVLLVIGKGPLLPGLRQEASRLGIASKVYFLGERSDVAHLLQCMDLYVQASLFEGMPNAVMEAMASGKPVVATGVDGTQELIEHGKTGWLVESADAGTLAEMITWVLRNQQQAALVGAAAAGRMAEDFSLEKMVSSFDRLFRHLLLERGISAG